MSEVTAKQVMALRDRTGVGMMDCKKALMECDGDIEKAIDYLREKGLAKAAAKAERAASEGLIRFRITDDRHGSMVLLNCETDFVAKTDDFKNLMAEITNHMGTADLPSECLGGVVAGEQLDLVRNLDLNGRTISEHITDAVAKLGENIQLGAVVVERSSDPRDYIQQYLHGQRIGVLVCLTTGKPETQGSTVFQTLAMDIAMQVAAAVPVAAVSVSRDNVDPALVERERHVLIEQAKAEGSSQEIAEKKVAGRLNKFFGEVALLEQPFIKDDKTTVGDHIKAVEKELGDTVTVARFHRFQLGE